MFIINILLILIISWFLYMTLIIVWCSYLFTIPLQSIQFFNYNYINIFNPYLIIITIKNLFVYSYTTLYTNIITQLLYTTSCMFYTKFELFLNYININFSIIYNTKKLTIIKFIWWLSSFKIIVFITLFIIIIIFLN